MAAKECLPVSVLIPTMNRPEALKQTLDTYMSSQKLPAEIVVVDQSTDMEIAKTNEEILSSCEGVKTVYIYQKKPSLTAARNNAVRAAGEDILVFSDDDVDVYEDTIENVYNLLSQENIAMVAGIDDNSAGHSSKIAYIFGTRSYKKRNIGHVTKSMLGRYPDMIKGQVTTQWAMGYFFSVKKSLLQKWQIEWDEKLTSYAYAEDLDCSYRYYKCAAEEEKKCVLDESVHVRHMVSKEYRVPSAKSTAMYVMNRYYLAAKHRMGFGSYAAMLWTDSCKLLEKIVKREKPMDLFKAMLRTIRHGAEIKRGRFFY